MRPLDGLFAGKCYRVSGHQPARTGSAYDCDLHIDAFDIALPDASVDCVICIEVLERLFAPLEQLCVTPLDGPIEFRLRSTPMVRFVDSFPVRQLIDLIDRPRRGKATTRHVVIGEKSRTEG